MEDQLHPACADPRDAMLLMLAERVQALESSLAASEARVRACEASLETWTHRCHETECGQTAICKYIEVMVLGTALKVDVRGIDQLLRSLFSGEPNVAFPPETTFAVVRMTAGREKLVVSVDSRFETIVTKPDLVARVLDLVQGARSCGGPSIAIMTHHRHPDFHMVPTLTLEEAAARFG